MRKTTGALAALFLLAGCGGTAESAQSDTMTVEGALVLTSGISHSGSMCHGANGYDDIAGGAQVVIRDPAENKVALGALDEGVYSNGSCRFHFKIANVPRRHGIYSVEVTHRGEVSFTPAEAGGVELSLG